MTSVMITNFGLRNFSTMNVRPLTPAEFSEMLDEDVIDPEITLNEARGHYQLLHVHYRSAQKESEERRIQLLEIGVELENERNMHSALKDDYIAAKDLVLYYMQPREEPKTPELPKEEAAVQEVLNSLQIENVQQKKTIEKLEHCCEEMTEGYLNMMEERQHDVKKFHRASALSETRHQEILRLCKENSDLESELGKAQHRISEQMIIIETLRKEKEIADKVQQEKAKEEVEKREAFAVARAERDKRREQVREREVDIDLAEAAERGEKRLRRSLLKEMEDEYVPAPEVGPKPPVRRINIRAYERNPRRTDQEMLEDQTRRFQQFKK